MQTTSKFTLCCAVVVILVSSFESCVSCASESSLQEYLAAGADAIISKGFKAKDVANEIQRLYHSKHLGGEIGFDLKARLQ